MNNQFFASKVMPGLSQKDAEELAQSSLIAECLHNWQMTDVSPIGRDRLLTYRCTSCGRQTQR